uniref:Small basic protein n=2 Tax=Acidiphilium TaxID=522 RepID=Q7DL71_ACIRU|nr:small basic protein [Acidiphilium rubrum]BAA25555.1 small basic protein [Acidiphilium angustum]
MSPARQQMPAVLAGPPHRSQSHGLRPSPRAGSARNWSDPATCQSISRIPLSCP